MGSRYSVLQSPNSVSWLYHRLGTKIDKISGSYVLNEALGSKILLLHLMLNY